MTLSNATLPFTNDTQLYSHHNKLPDGKLHYISYSFPSSSEAGKESNHVLGEKWDSTAQVL